MNLLSECKMRGQTCSALTDKSCLRSGGAGKSEIVCTHLYPNRWVLVNKIRIFASGDILRISLNRKTCDILAYHNIFRASKTFDKLGILDFE